MDLSSGISSRPQLHHSKATLTTLACITAVYSRSGGRSMFGNFVSSRSCILSVTTTRKLSKGYVSLSTTDCHPSLGHNYCFAHNRFGFALALTALLVLRARERPIYREFDREREPTTESQSRPLANQAHTARARKPSWSKSRAQASSRMCAAYPLSTDSLPLS